MRRLCERSCSPGGLTPLPDSWRIPHNGSGGQLFLWELASAEKKFHTYVEAWGGEEADALVENWILAFSSFPGKKLALGLGPSCHLSFNFTFFAHSISLSLYSLFLVAYSAWKLPIFRPMGQQEVPKSFLVSFLALANL